MKRDLAILALDMAVALRQPPEGCIHHTDRGSQYCSNEYQRRLSKHGFKASMSGKGNCYGNSMVLRRKNSPSDCSLILLTFFKSPSRDIAAQYPAGQ
jgi:transposase InsO family protein